MSTPTTETLKLPESGLRKGLKRIGTLCKNLVCLAAWTWLTSRVLRLPFPFEGSLASFLQWQYDPTVRLAAKVCLAASVMCVIVFRWHRAVLKFLFFLWIRMLFFPLIAAFYLFLVPYRSFRFVLRATNRFLDSFVRMAITKAAVLLILLLPASALMVLNSQDSLWLIVSAALTVLVLMITLRAGFRWTAKPLIIIEEALSTYKLVVSWYVKVIIGGAGQTSKDHQKQCDFIRSQFGVLHKSLDWLQSFTERNTDHRVVVRVFFFLFGICFLSTVVSFGILYLALSKMHPGAFANADSWELLDCVYSSLLVITTSGEIVPLWGAAKLAVAGEIVCGVSLLTLLIFQFSMISIPEVLEKRSHVLRVLLDQRGHLKELEGIYISNLGSGSESDG